MSIATKDHHRSVSADHAVLHGAKATGWNIEVFYDGDCPLCTHEIGVLRWMDRRQRIRFTDLADENFEAQSIGKTMSELMAEIHGRLPNGDVIVGVEVFRQLYAEVGFGWLIALTRLPVISHGLEFGYTVFARNRLRFTGRCLDSGCSV